MKIHHDFAPRGDRPPIALAIGFFDGLHRGHRAVFAALEPYVAAGARLAALSFRAHPARYLRPDSAPKMLVTLEERVNLLAQAGIEELYLLPFDAEIAALSPERFIDDYIAGMLKVRAVAVGQSFRFGAGRTGDAELAHGLLARHGIPFHAVAHVLEDGERISSTRIRTLLALGDIAGVDRMLGTPYALTGHVTLGSGRGHDLGFPTANLTMPLETELPPDGVYSARAMHEGIPHRSLVSIGTNPTFAGTARTVEVWIDAFDKTIYGHQIRIDTIRMIRSQRKFDDAEALQLQMHADKSALDALEY